MRGPVAALCGVVLATTGACRAADPAPPPMPAAPAVAPAPAPQAAPRQEAPMTAPASIGTATRNADGSITLVLRAEGPGMHGDAQFVYQPNDPMFPKVLQHLGGLEPGQTKPVPPWPDDE